MRSATKNQVKVLRYVRRCCDRGLPPTVREICQWFGWASTNAANQTLGALCKKGLLVREPRLARAMSVTPAGIEVLRLEA